MYWFANIYTFLHSVFEYLSFRTKPNDNLIEDVESCVDYEFVILKGDKMER
jgi:hypothetical protein